MEFKVKSGSRTQLIDITTDVQAALRDAGIREGLCMSRSTSTSSSTI